MRIITKKYFFVIFLLVGIIFCQENSYIDSIKKEIKGASEDEKAINYLMLGYYYSSYSPGEAIKTAKSGIELSKKYSSENLGNFYLLLCDNFNSTAQYDSVAYYSELALEFFTSRKDTAGICDAMINKGVFYDHTNQPAKAVKIYRQALELAEKAKLENRKAMIHTNIGIIAHSQGNNTTALREHLTALNIYEKTQKPYFLVNSYVNLGSVLMTNKNYKKAMDYFYKALKIAEKEYDYYHLYFIHYKLSDLYIEKEEWDKALEHINESLFIAKNTNQKLDYAYSLLDKTYIFIQKKKYNQVDSLFAVVEPEVNQLELPEISAYYYDVKCDYAIEKGLFDLALEYQNQSLDYLKTVIHSAQQIYHHELREGKIRYNLGQTDRAINIFENIIQKANNLETIDIKVEGYEELYKIYEETKNYGQALKYLKLYTDWADSLRTLQNKSNIEELEIIHNVQKQKQEKEILQKERDLFQSKAKSKNIILIILGILAFISHFTIVFVIKSIRNRKKGQRLLQAHISTIQQQNNELEKSLAAKDRLYTIIGHDLFNALANISSFINVLKRNMDNLNKEFLLKLTNELENINNNSLNLLKTLMEWGRIQTQKGSFNPIRFNLKALIHINLALFRKNIEEKKLNVINDVHPETYIVADKNMIGSVVRNIISNAVKFTPSEGSLHITSQKEKGHVILVFKDSGVGMDENTLNKIFKIEETITKKGTYGEKGYGLGLIICKELVEKHKGNISVESAEGEGTTFRITLPVKKEK